MNLLVVGGSGYVGRLVLPHLGSRFTLRIYDRNPPPALPGSPESPASPDSPPAPQPVRRPLRVALLHRRHEPQDERLARVLEERLAARGCQIQQDTIGVIGVEWALEKERILRTADAVILLLSDAGLRSELLRYEAATACHTSALQNGRPRILPVRMALQGELPEPLQSRLRALPFASWSGPHDDEALAVWINEALDNLESTAESAPRPGTGLDFVPGDVTDPDALLEAARGMDLLLYMAMGRVGAFGINEAQTAYDVNVKGVHMALDAAVRAGIKRAVYTSSLSVYDGHLDIRSGATDREETPAEPRTLYGFTKLLGEEVCRYFHRTHGLPVLALRLFHPVSREEWLARHPSAAGHPPYCCTTAEDLARALIAALELEHQSFEAIHITGDTSGRAYRHEKARRLLGWQPLQQPPAPGDSPDT